MLKSQCGSQRSVSISSLGQVKKVAHYLSVNVVRVKLRQSEKELVLSQDAVMTQARTGLSVIKE